MSIVASVIEVKKGKSKAGNDYMRLTLGDESGTLTGIMVGEKFTRFAANDKVPKEDEIVHIQGTKNDDGMWINKCEVQNYRIYFRVNDLKKGQDETE